MYVGHHVVTKGLLRTYMGPRDKWQTGFEENLNPAEWFSLPQTSLYAIFHITKFNDVKVSLFLQKPFFLYC